MPTAYPALVQTWAELEAFIADAAAEPGSHVLYVDPAMTSRTTKVQTTIKRTALEHGWPRLYTKRQGDAFGCYRFDVTHPQPNAEKVAVKRIGQLLKQGYTWRALSEQLNTEGITTPQGRQWGSNGSAAFKLAVAHGIHEVTR